MRIARLLRISFITVLVFSGVTPALAGYWGKETITAWFRTSSAVALRADLITAIVEMNGGVINSPSESASRFSDIPDGDPHFKYFMEAAAEGWYLGAQDCYGTSNCLAKPNDAMSLREVAVVAARAFGVERTGTAPTFVDNPTGASAQSSIQALADHCAITATDKGTIDAQNPLTRAEVIDILWKIDQQLTYGEDCEFPERLSSSSSSKRTSSSVRSSSSSHSSSATFTDVLGHRYADAIGFLRNEGVIGGYSDGTYRPDQQINRAEFLKIVLGAKFVDAEYCDPVYDFSDAGKTEWYSQFLCLAVRHGVVSGYTDGTFRPAQTINAAEAAKIVANTDTLDPNGGPWLRTIPPSDGGQWYDAFFDYIRSRDAMPSSIVSPQQPVTRGEMAEMIYRLSLANGEADDDTEVSSSVISSSASKSSSSSSAQAYEFSCDNPSTGGWYYNQHLRVCFNYSSAWPKPVQTGGSSQGGGVPYQTSLWRLLIGPICKGCAEGTDTYSYFLDGYPESLDVLSSLTADNSITIQSDTTKGPVRTIVFTEGGMCGNLKALIFRAGEPVLLLTGRCAADDAVATGTLNGLVLSLSSAGASNND